MHRLPILSCLLVILGGVGMSLLAADWPCFRGPVQLGVNPQEVILPWQTASVAWQADVGLGVSAVVVAGDKAITMGNENDLDVVRCFHPADGTVVWERAYSCKFSKRSFEGGTTSTPTIAGDAVYVSSYDGQIKRLNLADGKIVWEKHAEKDFQGVPPNWKYACSPLVVGDLVILDIGGTGASTIALKTATGDPVWAVGDEGTGYCTPVPYVQQGIEAVLLFKQGQLVSREIKTGNELWTMPWLVPYDVNASSPLVMGEILVVSSGYTKKDHAGRAVGFKLIAGQPDEVWRNEAVKTRITSCAGVNGLVFALSEENGNLMCLDPLTGTVHWQQPAARGGFVIGAGDNLIVLTEKGRLAICKAQKTGYQELCATDLPKGRYWGSPTVADGRIYCRTNEGKLTVISAR